MWITGGKIGLGTWVDGHQATSLQDNLTPHEHISPVKDRKMGFVPYCSCISFTRLKEALSVIRSCKINIQITSPLFPAQTVRHSCNQVCGSAEIKTGTLFLQCARRGLDICGRIRSRTLSEGCCNGLRRERRRTDELGYRSHFVSRRLSVAVC